MTDDLVKRLREDQPVTQDMESTIQCALQDEAADRIEALTTERDALAAEVERLRRALTPLTNRAAYAVSFDDDRFNFAWMVSKARAALEEGKDG